MITIQATKKLLDKLKVEPRTNLPATSGRLGPWYADVRVMDRKHIVYVLNEQSLLCVVVPWTSFKADPAGTIRTALRPVLEALGLPDDMITPELSAIDGVSFTKTSSRVTLGRLNSAVNFSEHMIYKGMALVDVGIRLASHYYSVGQGRSSYDLLSPYDLVGQIFAHPTTPTIMAPSFLAEPSEGQPQRTPAPVQSKPVLKGVVVLRIVLDGIRPEIWRLILVPDTITLRRLHDVIQAAMGWDEMHLHSFKIKGREYGDLEMFDDGPAMKEERFVSFQSLQLAVGDTFTYIYDMGDYWSHTITVEAAGAVEADSTFHIIDGANAVPPEDVGGVHGYALFVLAMMDPQHKDHISMMNWHGRPFDHTMFDLRAARRLLAVLEYSGAGYPWK